MPSPDSATAPPVEGTISIRRRASRALLWLSGLTMLAPLLATAIGRPLGWVWLKPWALGALPVCLVLGPLIAICAAIVATPTTRRPASVQVGADEVTIDQQGTIRRIARRDIDGGMLVPSGGQPYVEVYVRGGDVLRLAVRDEAAGNQLLDALDIGPDERRVRVTLQSPQRRAVLSAGRAVVVIFACVMLLGFVVDAYKKAFGVQLPPTFLGPWLAMVAAGILGWNRLSRPTEIVVGAEGVRIVEAVKDRMLSYDELRSVEVKGRALVLTGRDGRTTAVAGDIATLQGLARRIHDAMSAASTTPDRVAERLDRQGRTVSEWRTALATLVGDAGYRSARLAREVAEQVLEDGSASAERRIGAALALASRGGDEAKSRIRIAANRTADEKLRVVLEAVAEEQEVEDELVLGSIEQREARRSHGNA